MPCDDDIFWSYSGNKFGFFAVNVIVYTVQLKVETVEKRSETYKNENVNVLSDRCNGFGIRKEFLIDRQFKCIS